LGPPPPMTSLRELRDEVRHYGVRSTLYDVWIRSLNRLFFYRVLCGMKATSPHPEYLGLDPKYEHGFVAPARLEAIAVAPEYDLSPAFLRGAFAKGDRCYGLLCRGPGGEDVLASYGWYSRRPTQLYEGLDLHFGDGWVYMYKGYTMPAYRGKRLHAVGICRALRALTDEGRNGLISCVASNNFASLHSVTRMGYRIFGDVYLLLAAGRSFTYATRGCQPYGFWVQPLTPARDVSSAKGFGKQ